MRHALLAGTVLLAAGVANLPHASAQQPGLVIQFLDRNADGKCDLNEYLTYQAGRIPQFDKDGDGELILAEFRESLQGRSKANANVLFKNANAEGGRTLSRREFLGYHAWVFKTFIDADSDGFMSEEEWTKIMERAG